MEKYNFTEVVEYFGVGASSLPKSEWGKTGVYPIIGQGESYIEGWTDRGDLVVIPDSAGFIVYGGHTRRVKFVSRPFVPGPNIKILKPKSLLLGKYLYFYLIHNPVESKGYADHFPLLRRISVPVPSLEEQKRSILLLEEAELLKDKVKNVLVNMDNVIPSLFVKMFGDPENGTNKFPVVDLNSVSIYITDGTHQPPKFINAGIPFLFVKNIVSGKIDFNTEKFISEEVYQELTKKYKPDVGNILYSTVGSYGVAVEIKEDRKFSFQRHIGHISPDKSKIDPTFLCAQLNTPFVKKQADLRARGVAQKTVNLQEIRKFKIVVPPIELQKKFTKLVEEIEVKKNKQKESAQKINELFSSLMSKVFYDRI